MTEYARSHAAIVAVGADVAALSVDSQARSEGVRAELALPFPILCDSARTVVRGWELYNAKEMGGIAIPGVFVVGPDLRVRYRSIDDTAKRVSTEGVLRFLRGEAPEMEIARERVRVGIGDFVRAIRNAIRRGLRTPDA